MQSRLVAEALCAERAAGTRPSGSSPGQALLVAPVAAAGTTSTLAVRLSGLDARWSPWVGSRGEPWRQGRHLMSGIGAFPAALGCVALALVALPGPAARRRFDAMFRAPARARKRRMGRVIRLSAGLAPVAVMVLGVGPMLAAISLAFTFGLRRRRGIRERCRIEGCAQLLEGLEAVIGELRIGAHPSAAAATAARETEGEAAHAFAVSAARSRLGGSGADGFRQSEAVVAQELSRIAEAWRVAEEHGLALAELLTAARLDLLGRRRFRDRTRAALAGARATAAVLALLPLIGIGLGQLMGAAPLTILFADPAGTVLLPLGTALTCAGLLWTDAITERVLR